MHGLLISPFLFCTVNSRVQSSIDLLIKLLTFCVSCMLHALFEASLISLLQSQYTRTIWRVQTIWGNMVWHKTLMLDVIIMAKVIGIQILENSENFIPRNILFSLQLLYTYWWMFSFYFQIPSLVIGPFGCGKTHTMIQCVNLLALYTDLKVLICTHSNSAADLYVKAFHREWKGKSKHVVWFA